MTIWITEKNYYWAGSLKEVKQKTIRKEKSEDLVFE